MSKTTKTNTQQQQATRTAKNWVDYESLKAALTLDAVLAHYGVALRGTGDQKSGFCPLPTHQGKATGKKSPSFSAHAVKGAWHCFGCGAKGNALELAVRLEGHIPDDPANFREGALAVRNAFGLGPTANSGDAGASRTPQDRRKPSDATKPGSKAKRRPAGRKASHSTPSASPPVDEDSERVEEEEDTDVEVLVNAPLDFELQHLDPEHPYLAGRGFEPETVEHFGLGYCGKGLMKGRIAIPVRDEQGHLVAYAGRLVDDEAVDTDAPKYRFPGPVERDGTRREFRKSLVLYHAHDLWPRRAGLSTVYVVEGFPACWHLWQHWDSARSWP